MSVLRLRALLFGTLPLILINCSSGDDPGATSGSGGKGGTAAATGGSGMTTGGSATTAGTTSTAGTVGTAGSAAHAGGGAGGSASTGGSTSGGSGGTTGGTTGGAGGASGGSGGASAGGSSGSGGGSGTFTLTSPNQVDGAKFDGKYTCNGAGLGKGVVPELDWSGIPAGTMSLAITFIDTSLIDGAQPMLGAHWAVWNIPTTAMKLPEGTKTLTGDFAMAKQAGNFLAPCAQSAAGSPDDNYEFTVWALPTATLTVASGAATLDVYKALKALTPKPPTAVLKGHAGPNGK